MTADLDLSPEAVERLLFSQERQDQISQYDRGRSAGRDEAMAETAPLIRKLAEQASALASENARLRAANGDEGGFCGDTIGKQAIGHLREMYRSAFDALGPSGRVSLRNFIDNRLRAERDAARQAGAKAMLEAAAQTCVLSGQDLAGGDWGPEGRAMAVMLERRIRALPLPDQPKDGA